MPNIEFHGFNHVNASYLSVQRIRGVELDPIFETSFAQMVVEKVRELLSKTEHAVDVVFTEYVSQCYDINRRPAPFIRICDTDKFRATRIAMLLARHLLVDIEFVELDGFWEARKSFDE